MSLSLSLWLLVFSIPAISLPLLLRSWTETAKLQLKLNNCTKDFSLFFKKSQEQMEAVRREMKALRAAIAAASLKPALQVPLKAALQLEFIRGTAVLTAWKARQAQWLLQAACGARGGMSLPAPGLNWRSLPPDFLGPKPFERMGMETLFTFETFAKKRSSKAVVLQRNGRWRARWVPAVQF